MVFPLLPNPRVTTATTYGGDTIVRLHRYWSGYNIADADSTNKPSINTDTRFYNGRLILFDSDQSNEIKFVTPNLLRNVSVSFPPSLSDMHDNEILFRQGVQEIEDKILDAEKNGIINLSDENISETAGIDWLKINLENSELEGLGNVDSTNLANNVVLRYDQAADKWICVIPSDISVPDATEAVKGKVKFATAEQTDSLLAIQASDTRLINARLPLDHAIRHKKDGMDEIKLNELGIQTENVPALNSTTLVNGLVPPIPDDSTLFLNGQLNWAAPPGTGGGPPEGGTGVLMSGVTTRDGDGTTKIFTIAHGFGEVPNTYIVTPNSVDAQGSFTRAIDDTNITVTYQISPPIGTANLSFSWIVMDEEAAGGGGLGGEGTGEANTASSVGGGAAWTKPKDNLNLPFKSFIVTDKLILLPHADDITLDVDEQALAIDWSQLDSVPTELVKTNQVNTYGSYLQTFPSSFIKILNVAGSHGTRLVSAAVAGDYNLSIPLLTGHDDIVAKALAQEITSKIINTSSNTLTTSSAQQGSILVYGTDKYDKLDKGNSGQVLTAGPTTVSWQNPSVGTAREDLAIFMTHVMRIHPTSSYTDMKCGYWNGESNDNEELGDMTASVDFTNKTQYKMQFNIMRDSSDTTPSSATVWIRLVDSTNNANVLWEKASITSDVRQTIALTGLPLWCVGVKNVVIQCKANDDTIHVYLANIMVWLK